MYRLFSVDDHVIEHGRVWTDRVPAKFRETAPHVVGEGDHEIWVYEDVRFESTMGLNAVAGKPREEWSEPRRFDQMIPGCYDRNARAADMLSNGIYASVCFPSLPRFGGALFTGFKDKALADACVRAYNDFMIDEWCAPEPRIFVPMIIGQLWDPDAMALEIRRAAALGARAVTMPEDTWDLGLPSYYDESWDVVWAACQETEMPVCMHIGSSGRVPQIPPGGSFLIAIAAAFTRAAEASISLMLSPVCRKFPELKIVWSEGGIGWVPAALERADRQWERHLWGRTDSLRPSEIAARNMWWCMIEEPIGLKYRYDIGVDRILWESDYPHADTPWPHAQEGAAEVFAGVPAHEVERITHLNAEQLFHWTLATPDVSKPSAALSATG